MACENVSSKTKRVCIGRMNKRISVQERIDYIDSTTGDTTKTFVEVLAPWADVITLGLVESSNKYYAGMQLNSNATHIFNIRYKAGLTQQNWVLFDGNRYDILSINTFNEGKRFLSLTCGITGEAGLDASSK